MQGKSFQTNRRVAVAAGPDRQLPHAGRLLEIFYVGGDSAVIAVPRQDTTKWNPSRKSNWLPATFQESNERHWLQNGVRGGLGPRIMKF